MGRKPQIGGSFAIYKDMMFIIANYKRCKEIIQFTRDPKMMEACMSLITRFERVYNSLDGQNKRIMSFVMEKKVDPELSSSHFYRLRIIAVNTFLERFYAQ